MHTPLIAYLVLIIKLQRQIILILLAQLAEIFDHSRLPRADKPVFKRFNQFQVDEKVPLLQADIGSEALDYQQLIAESLGYELDKASQQISPHYQVGSGGSNVYSGTLTT